MHEDERSAVRNLLANKEGIILVTGPTGSGKTTTLYSALRLVQSEGVNIVTVEDPVEYRLGENIVQVQVQREGRAHLRLGAALDPAAGPRRRARRRDPRPGDGADRGAGVAHRPPGALDAAHQRRARTRSPGSWTWAWRRTRSPPRSAAWWRSGSCGGSAPPAGVPATRAGARARRAVHPGRDAAVRGGRLPRVRA